MDGKDIINFLKITNINLKNMELIKLGCLDHSPKIWKMKIVILMF